MKLSSSVMNLLQEINRQSLLICQWQLLKQVFELTMRRRCAGGQPNSVVGHTAICFGTAKAFAKVFLQWGQVLLDDEDVCWPDDDDGEADNRPRLSLRRDKFWEWEWELEWDEWWDEVLPKCVVSRRWEGRSSLNCRRTELASGKEPREDKLLLSSSGCVFLSCLFELCFLCLPSLLPCSIIMISWYVFRSNFQRQCAPFYGLFFRAILVQLILSAKCVGHIV